MPQLDEAAMDFKEAFEFVLRQGAMLAMLPLEDWLAGLERADAIGPILDPTLYREYLWSGRDQLTKDVLRAAIQFKAAILRAQSDVKAGKVK